MLEKVLKLGGVGLFANLLAKAVDSADGGLDPFAKQAMAFVHLGLMG